MGKGRGKSGKKGGAGERDRLLGGRSKAEVDSGGSGSVAASLASMGSIQQGGRFEREFAEAFTAHLFDRGAPGTSSRWWVKGSAAVGAVVCPGPLVLFGQTGLVKALRQKHVPPLEANRIGVLGAVGGGAGVLGQFGFGYKGISSELNALADPHPLESLDHRYLKQESMLKAVLAVAAGLSTLGAARFWDMTWCTYLGPYIPEDEGWILSMVKLLPWIPTATAFAYLINYNVMKKAVHPNRLDGYARRLLQMTKDEKAALGETIRAQIGTVDRREITKMELIGNVCDEIGDPKSYCSTSILNVAGVGAAGMSSVAQYLLPAIQLLPWIVKFFSTLPTTGNSNLDGEEFDTWSQLAAKWLYLLIGAPIIITNAIVIGLSLTTSIREIRERGDRERSELWNRIAPALIFALLSAVLGGFQAFALNGFKGDLAFMEWLLIAANVVVPLTFALYGGLATDVYNVRAWRNAIRSCCSKAPKADENENLQLVDEFGMALEITGRNCQRDVIDELFPGARGGPGFWEGIRLGNPFRCCCPAHDDEGEVSGAFLG